MIEGEVTEELQEFLAKEFEEVIKVYLDDVENLIECESIYTAQYTCFPSSLFQVFPTNLMG